MRSRVLIDLAFIVLIYGIYFAAVLLLYGQGSALTGYPDPGDPIDYYPWIALGVSLMAMLAWYAIGEFGLRGNAPDSTWYTVWFLLLALIVVAAAVVTIFEPGFIAELFRKDASGIDTYPWLHFVGGIGAFYVGVGVVLAELLEVQDLAGEAYPDVVTARP